MQNLTNIGVMIPTLNSMPAIKAHVSALNEWIRHVGHVVVVDSHSTDGTLDYLRKNLAHDQVTFIDRPRGLYQSWNEGISHIRTKYTYISTVGDLISAANLQRLYEQAEEHHAPVVLSPPRLLDTNGKQLDGTWPIHQFIEEHVKSSVYHLSAVERLAYSCLHSPSTLIGSSASNLYRTQCLQESPFPTDFGHSGDAIWALTRPLDEDWVIMKDVESTFLIHEKTRQKNNSSGGFRPKIYALTKNQLRKMEGMVSGVEKDLIEYCLTEMVSFWEHKESVMSHYREIKKGAIPWYLSAQGWSVRRQKSALRARMKQIKNDVQQHLLICKAG